MPALTVLVVTEGAPGAWPYVDCARALAERRVIPFVLALDVHARPYLSNPVGIYPVVVNSHGAGYLEAVLNDALDACDTEYVLRIDDDETVSAELTAWLSEWVTDPDPAPQYTFPRAALWPDYAHRIDQPPWWPDPQARLATRELSRRDRLHEPWRGEEVYVPHPIVHHTYLCHDDAWHARRKAAYAIARPDCPYPMPDEGTKVVAI